MNCYYCEKPMSVGRYATWGRRTVVVHKHCERDDLLERAYAMGLFTAAEERTDQELVEAIAAEKISVEWLARVERLPADEQQEAWAKLGRTLS